MQKYFVFCLFCCFLTRCVSVERQHFFGSTQGSYYSIIYYDEQNRNFSREFDSIFQDVENTLSLWDENSVIRRVNRNDSAVVLNKIFVDNFNYAMRAAELSDGYFDLFLIQLINILTITAEILSRKILLGTFS